MKKKNHTIFLTAAMILALGVPPVTGQAAVPTTDNESPFEEIVPAYEVTGDIKPLFSITGNKAKLSIIASAPSSKKVSIKMVLQRKDGSSWTRVQKWTKTGTGTQTLSKSMTVTNGRTYRMKYTVTVGSEQVTGKTATKTA